jgi:hypothetical protein
MDRFLLYLCVFLDPTSLELSRRLAHRASTQMNHYCGEATALQRIIDDNSRGVGSFMICSRQSNAMKVPLHVPQYSSLPSHFSCRS